MAIYVDNGYHELGYIQTGITVYWGTRIIFVPKSEMTLIQQTPTEIRELNINTFRLALKDLEDNADGMIFPNTHSHNTEVSLGGVTFARLIEIINDYTVTFEDGNYAVNLVGANSNIGDRVNVNRVSVRSSNSAGLIVQTQVIGGIGTVQEVQEAVWSASLSSTDPGTTGDKLKQSLTTGNFLGLK